MSEPQESDTPLPLVAPCRALRWNAALNWLRLGWADVRAAPRVSIGYGVITVLLSYAISTATWLFGSMGLYLGVLSGFVFLAPLIGLTLYSISARLARGAEVSFTQTARDTRAALSDAMVFALVLLVVFLIWARSAAMVHIFFPVGSDPTWREWLQFLGIGSTAGAVFCAIIFTASAFSLPMLLDRNCDTITAVVTSVNATLRNKPAMLFWAVCIGLCVLLGVATAYLGFALLMPLLGHAAWHAYRETVDAEAWPQRRV